MTNLCAFACRVSGAEWGETTVNALTAGGAKVEYWRSVTEAWPGIQYTAVRARKLGPAQSSERFLSNAAYRGMPDIRCGDEVTVNGHSGLIAGHNSSANFDVLFIDGPWNEKTINVHPSEIRRRDGRAEG